MTRHTRWRWTAAVLSGVLIGVILFALSFRVSVQPDRAFVSIALSPRAQAVYADAERLAPDAILQLSNLTGVVSSIQDDPDAPDGNWLTQTGGNNVNTFARVSFATPTGNPTVGADLQEFRALVRKYGGTGTPTARIELYENGSLIRAGNENNVTGALVISFTWNANEIGITDGSLVEARVYGTKSGGSPSARAAVEVGAVEWNVDYSVGGGDPEITVSPTSYDFGVVTVSSTPSTITTYFTVDNTSSGQTDQTIAVTASSWPGGAGWMHDDTATPGADTVGLKANKGGTWGVGDVIVKFASPNYIAENQAALTDYQFGLKMWAPTSFSEGAQKSNTVRITAAAG